MHDNDTLNPQWRERSNSAHDWHAYVSEEVRMLWNTFSDMQKKALADCFKEISDTEEWN